MSSRVKFVVGGGAALLCFALAAAPGAHVRLADVGPAVVAATSPPPAVERPPVFVEIDPTTTASIAKSEPSTPEHPARILPPVPELAPLELQRFSAAAQLYRKGALSLADAVAAKIDDPVERLALDWLALKAAPGPDGRRLAAFSRAYPDWPDDGWMRAVEESSLYSRHAPSAEIDAAFARTPPQTPPARSPMRAPRSAKGVQPTRNGRSGSFGAITTSTSGPRGQSYANSGDC